MLGLGATGLSVIRKFSGHKFPLPPRNKSEGAAVIGGFDEGFDRFGPDLRKFLRRKLAYVVTDRRLLGPRIRESDWIVASPGVPLQALGLGCGHPKIIGDVDLAYLIRGRRRFLVVTGTNGKTTTTKLLAAILREKFGRRRVAVAGNIGTPLLDEISKKEYSWYVVEMSSFQLELAKHFRAAVGVFLNLSQNHLDRHRTMGAYFEAKARLFRNCRGGDVAVLNLDDPYGMKLAGRLASKRCRRAVFSLKGVLPADGLFLRGQDVFRKKGNRSSLFFTLPKHNFGPGRHNLSNLLAAAAAADAVNVPPSAIRAAIRKFRLPAHRLEFVREAGGVAYYDDSKATSVDAARKAMESFPSRQIVALMGGQDKGMNFEPLFRDLTRRRNLKSLVFFGSLGEKFSRLAGRYRLPHRQVGRVAEAVRVARDIAAAGDVVLLSPGGTSFDQYKSYEERGLDFRRCVEKLK